MIDFLLENPLLLIFLIGIITSLFGRKKVDDQQTDKQKQPRGQTVREGCCTTSRYGIFRS